MYPLLSRSTTGITPDLMGDQGSILLKPEMRDARESMSSARPTEFQGTTFLERAVCVIARMVGLGFVFVYLPYCFLENQL